MSLTEANWGMTCAQARQLGVKPRAIVCAGCNTQAMESDRDHHHCQPCADALVGLYVPDTRIQIGPTDI